MSKLQELYEQSGGDNPVRKGDLSRLFGEIIHELDLDDKQIRLLMYKWVNDPSNKVPNDPSSRSSARGNIRKDIRREEITWKVFKKLIRWLRPIRGRLVIELDWENGKTSRHQINMDGDEFPIINLGTVDTEGSASEGSGFKIGNGGGNAFFAKQQDRLRRAKELGSVAAGKVANILDNMTDEEE